MTCSPPNTRIYAKEKKRPQIPLEYTKILLKETKIHVVETIINSIPDIPIRDSEPVSADFVLSEYCYCFKKMSILQVKAEIL